MTQNKEIYYVVTGGCILNKKETFDISEAYFEFFHRIKMTRPESNSIIEIRKITEIQDEYLPYVYREIKNELIHRVVLS